MRAAGHVCRPRAALLLAGAITGLLGCGSRGPAPRSAVLVTLDTTRADALSCYGNPEGTTPVLDALAAEGVAYDAAHTVTALTLPAHASMLTGLAPLRHGLRDNGVAPLPAEALTLAERARAAGVETAAFVSSVVLDDDFGLEQGFELYSVPSRRNASERAHGAERSARETIDAALTWLATRDLARPFFLWVHLYDPHHPYAPPAPFAGRFSTPYLGEVAAMDHELGRLFDALRAAGRWDETFVLAVADHGEAFGEHGEVTHGTYCYETTLRVPLVARWPGSAAARRVGRSSALVGVVDVAPTLAEAMGLAPIEGLDGESFFPRDPPPERGLYFESYYGYLAYGWSPLTGWMDGAGKYLHSSEPEFFDWRADPSEAHDVLAERGDALGPYREAITRLAAKPALALGSPSGDGDGETLAGIRALGYASSGEDEGPLPPPLAESTLPSPRSQIGFFAAQARAQQLATAGNEPAAAAVYEEVLRGSPNNFAALEELAAIDLKLGRADEAVRLLERLAHEGPQRGRAYHQLGLALIAARRYEDALAPLTRAVELTHGRGRYLDVLRQTLARLGRESEFEALRARYER